MVRTPGNQKKSIIVVLTISILSSVLLTSTVINTVSAAGSINIQPKTNLVTSTRSPHIISSATHRGVNIQPKTNLVTSTRSPHIISAAHGTKCKSGPCPNGTWGSKFTVFLLTHPKPREYDYNGILVGETGSGVWYGIKSAPIKIGIAYRDGHCCLPYPSPDSSDKWMGVRDEIFYNGHPGEPGDGKFSGFFAACDDPKANDHTAYVTAYFEGGRAMNIDTYFPHPGPGHGDTAYDYDSTDSLKDLGSNSRLLSIERCGQAYITDMHVASNPSQNYNITFSGKLIDEWKHPINGARIVLQANYMDNKPGHTHAFNCYLARTDKTADCIQQGVTSKDPGSGMLVSRPTTKTDGTFSGSFAACDLSIYSKPGSGYQSNAGLIANYDPGYAFSGLPPQLFTTKPCSY
jgi:hypothetical protein